MSKDTTSIIIIDDHQLFADGLEMLLTQLPGEISISKYSSAQAVLSSPNLLAEVDLVLIDLNMPAMSGFAFLRALDDEPNSPSVAVISGAENRRDIEQALALGAMGFIPKDASGSDMLSGIASILSGQRFLPSQWLGKIDWPSRDAVDLSREPGRKRLGKRQRQVLKLLEEGLQNKQIALVLGVSVSTVKSHTQSLYRTLNVSNRTACIKAANEQGLL